MASGKTVFAVTVQGPGAVPPCCGVIVISLLTPSIATCRYSTSESLIVVSSDQFPKLTCSVQVGLVIWGGVKLMDLGDPSYASSHAKLASTDPGTVDVIVGGVEHQSESAKSYRF